MSDYTFTCAGGGVTTAMNLEYRLVISAGGREALVFTDDGVTANPDVPIDDAAKAVIDAVMLQRPAPLHRTELIRELVEKVPEGLWGFSASEQRTVAEWLQEQMEGDA